MPTPTLYPPSYHPQIPTPTIYPASSHSSTPTRHPLKYHPSIPNHPLNRHSPISTPTTHSFDHHQEPPPRLKRTPCTIISPSPPTNTKLHKQTLTKLMKNLQPIVRHFFKGCRQPEYVFGQELCQTLKDERGQVLPSPVNADSSFFMEDLSEFFEWSRMHLVLHTNPPTHRTTLLVDDFPYKCIPNPLGCYINLPSFTSNQSLDPLHNYLQRLLSSQRYVLDFVGSNPYPTGQGPFNLEQPSSLIFKQSLARHKTLTSAHIVPEEQMT